MPEWLAHCHSCLSAHADWTTGDVWQCNRCLFRIPAAHVWWWCPVVQKREEARRIVQERMEL